MEAETAAEKEARWTKMAEEEIAEWKRYAKSSGSSTAPLPGKPREVERDRERMGGATAPEPEVSPPSYGDVLRGIVDEDLDFVGALDAREKALTPGTSEFAARKSRSGTLSTKFVKNLLTPGTSEFAARDSRGGLDFSGKRIDASDGQPYDFASFQEIYGPQAEELWSIAEPTAQGKKNKRKGKKH